MRKGLNTLDALFAIVILLLTVGLMQNYTQTTLNSANDYGGGTQAKSLAISIGSQINSFFATNPGSKDYLDISKDPLVAKLFGKTTTTTITKVKNDVKVSVDIATDKDYVSTYPTIKDPTYSSPKVTT